jgi:hypothetical protein
MMRTRVPAGVVLALCGGLLPALAGCSRTVVSTDSAANDPPPAAADAGAATGPTFRFPEDRGGELLAKLLAPAEPRPTVADPSEAPHPDVPAPRFDAPSLPLPPGVAVFPALPPDDRRPALRPRLTLDESPAGPGVAPRPPEVATFPVGDRIRLQAADVNKPPPLPILATPVPDRAPVDDATVEASTAAALAAPLPQRTAPAPYARVAVPDPYEGRRGGRLAESPEPAPPVAAAPRAPGR